MPSAGGKTSDLRTIRSPGQIPTGMNVTGT